MIEVLVLFFTMYAFGLAISIFYQHSKSVIFFSVLIVLSIVWYIYCIVRISTIAIQWLDKFVYFERTLLSEQVTC